MSEKFTDGPWVHSGSIIVSVHENKTQDVICIGYDRFEDDLKNWPANAALIAAAPDLLAALEEMMVHAEYFFPHSESFKRANAAYDAAEKAILKAYGQLLNDAPTQTAGKERAAIARSRSAKAAHRDRFSRL